MRNRTFPCDGFGPAILLLMAAVMAGCGGGEKVTLYGDSLAVGATMYVNGEKIGVMTRWMNTQSQGFPRHLLLIDREELRLSRAKQTVSAVAANGETLSTQISPGAYNAIYLNFSADTAWAEVRDY